MPNTYGTKTYAEALREGNSNQEEPNIQGDIDIVPNTEVQNAKEEGNEPPTYLQQLGSAVSNTLNYLTGRQ